MLAHSSIRAVQDALSRHSPRRIAVGSGWVHAAVALVVRPAPDDLELLLIKRAPREGDPWSGHMALPGGRSAAHDKDAITTAIRETGEEVGIDLTTRGTWLGALDDVSPLGPGTPPIIISSFVFAVPVRTEAVPNFEVEAAMWIPLQLLLHPDARAEYLYEFAEDATLRFPAFAYQEHIIWGLTYRILSQFMQVTGFSTGRER